MEGKTGYWEEKKNRQNHLTRAFGISTQAPGRGCLTPPQKTAHLLEVAVIPQGLLREKSYITEWAQDWSQKASSTSSSVTTNVRFPKWLKPSQSVKQE